MKILLIDDHKMFREGISMFLTSQKQSWSITSCESIEESFTIILENNFDIIVSDLNLPGKNVYDLLEYLNKNNKDIPILVLSMESKISNLIKLLKLGIKGYISKESSSFQVVQSIEAIVNGEYYFGPVLLEQMVEFLIYRSEYSNKKRDNLLDSLSKRESEVYDLLVQNSELNVIAKNLFVSKKTIENHRTSIYKKLGVSDRYSLQNFKEINNPI